MHKGIVSSVENYALETAVVSWDYDDAQADV
jgi:hypothetical protein